MVVIRVDPRVRSSAARALMFGKGVSSMDDLQTKPKGTIAVLVVFALLIVILWGSVYLAMLLRGATQ
jgi:hypothetical protein